jgi:hypothetical protein
MIGNRTVSPLRRPVEGFEMKGRYGAVELTQRCSTRTSQEGSEQGWGVSDFEELFEEVHWRIVKKCELPNTRKPVLLSGCCIEFSGTRFAGV